MQLDHYVIKSWWNLLHSVQCVRIDIWSLYFAELP